MENKPYAVIFDMDGTLVDVSSIRHYVLTVPGQKNFDAFHSEAVTCPPIDWVREAALEFKSYGYTILQVTARSEKYRRSTGWWIAENRIPSDGLYMRNDRDYRPDSDVKREIIDRLLKRYTIIRAYDDNPSIIRLWGEYVIPCVTVPGWAE